MDTTSSTLDHDPTDPWSFPADFHVEAELNKIEHECELLDGIREHGSIDAYSRFLLLQRQLDPDRALARSVAALFRHGHNREFGYLQRCDKRRIMQDIELTAFFISVAKSRDDGWTEEKLRIDRLQKKAAKSTCCRERLQAFEIEAIYNLLPLWRQWGRLLIEQNAVPELDEFVHSYSESA